jgi:hypothetical protein
MMAAQFPSTAIFPSLLIALDLGASAGEQSIGSPLRC